MAFRTLLTLALLAVFTIASARIESLGLATAQATRSKLSDSAFVVRPVGTPQIIAPDRRFFAFATSPSRKPALAATDTQVQVNTVTVRAGKPFFKHFHPRGVETLTVLKGRVLSQTWFEGSNPRVIKVTLRPRDSTVYPQGLMHLARCVSKTDCVFTAVFNSADAGTVPVA